MTILRNRVEAKYQRRSLRRNLTDAERKLWSKVRNRQLMGFKFFRQYSFGHYFLDLFCPVAKLAVELDGGQHALPAQLLHDKKRTEYLNQNNVKIIRFWDNDVLKNIDGALLEISKNLTPPAPSLKKRGGIKM